MLSQQMKVFMQVAESGSFTKASTELLLTPAAVMKHMNNLENDMGVTLLIRTHQGVQLTSAGESFYQSGKKILDSTNRAVSLARDVESAENVNIRIGSSLLNSSTVFTKLWLPIQKKYPQYKFSIVPFEDNQEKIISILSSLGEKIDIIVGSFNSKSMYQSSSYLPLGSYRFCIAVPKNHPLAKKKEVSFADMNGEKLVLVKHGDSPLIDELHDLIDKKYPQIKVVETSFYYDIDTFNQCEQSGSLLLSLDEWSDVHPSFATIPLKGNYRLSYGVLYPKEPSERIKKFIEIIKKELVKE